MSKKCGKCEKTVYPAEELKCLDKSWHKACFKCWECGMALTMKNYKGYSKLPYCSAHYPQITATVVADTPEGRRNKEISNLNSKAVYQADYVNNIRGTVTSMAEDNETKHVKAMGNIISPSAYRTKSEADGESHDGGRGHQSEANYTKPMRSYNEEEDGRPEAPRSYMPVNPNAGRMLPIPGSAAQAAAPEQKRPLPPQPTTGPTYLAMYDYEAQDADEVGFQENDHIINCEVIDEGWVVGTVQRTGEKGMIPSNYIEQM